MTRLFITARFVLAFALLTICSAAQAQIPVLQAGSNETSFQQLTPDEKWGVMISEFGAVKIWDARTGELSRAWPLDGSSIGWSDMAALSPDGKTLATVHYHYEVDLAKIDKSKILDGQPWEKIAELRLNEVPSGRLLATLQTATTYMRGLRFSPDGALLAAITNGVETYDGFSPPDSPSDFVSVWNVASTRLLWSKPPARADEATQRITQIEFAPDGDTLACLTGKNPLSRNAPSDGFAWGKVDMELCEPRTGKVLRILTQNLPDPKDGSLGESVGRFEYSPDSKIIVINNDTTWNAATGRKINGLSRVSRGNVNFWPLPNKTSITYFDFKSNYVEIWNLLTGTLTRRVTLEGVSPKIDWLPDGVSSAGDDLNGWIFTVRQDFRVKDKIVTGERNWDIRTGKRVLEPSWQGGARSVGIRKIVRETESHGIAVHDIRTGHVSQSEVLQPWRFPLRAVAFSPDGAQVACGTDGQIALWNLESGAMQFFPAFGGQRLTSLAFSPDGSTLAAGGGLDLQGKEKGAVVLWNARTAERLRVLPARPFITTAIVFTDNQTLACANGILSDYGNGAGEVSLWNVASGKLNRILLKSDHPVNALSATQDGKLAVVGHRSKAQLWDITSGKMLSESQSEGDYLQKAIAVSSNGTRVAHGEGNSVKLWDGKTGAPIQTLDSGRGTLSLAFSPDDKNLAAAAERTASLWSADGVLMHRMTTHADTIWNVAFSPDGSTLATAGLDGLINFWDAASSALNLSLAFSPSSKPNHFYWIAWTPDGFFDGSAGCEKFLRHRVGATLLPVEESNRKFHQRERLQSTLSFRKMDATLIKRNIH